MVVFGTFSQQSATAHTRHTTTHISNDTARTAQLSAAAFGLKWVCIQQHMGRTPEFPLHRRLLDNTKLLCVCRNCNKPESLKDPSCPETNTVKRFVLQGHSDGQCNRLTHYNAIVCRKLCRYFSNQLCVERGNIVLPLQGAYKCLTQTTSGARFCAKGCQNCQNPKLLGQSLIQEQ